MSQHDFNIANDTAPNVRADLNNALVALATQSSGATEPSTTYVYMPWYDTSTATLKIRNSANTAWNPFLDHIEISKVGWQLYAGTYTNNTISVSSQDTTPRGLFLKPDGLKMYLAGAANDAIYQYSLSTAWDLSTASYDSVSLSITTVDTNPRGLFFKTDGLKMYVVGGANNRIDQYSLTSAWDLSTASYDSVSFSIATEDTDPTGIFIKPDGLKMYLAGAANDSVYQYSLTSAWDLSTASYDSVSLDVSNEDTDPTGVFFKNEGTKMYVAGIANDSIYQYSLSTVWDLSTANYDGVSLSVNSEGNNPRGIFIKADGTMLYIAGDTGDAVYQYNMYILAG